MLTDVFNTAEYHRVRAAVFKSEIEQWESLDASVFDDNEKVKSIDAFIFRFIKLQDLMGQKLFRIFLDEIGDYRDDMSLLDVLDRLEKLRLVDNPAEWMAYRKLLNELTHEYPDNQIETLEGITLALEAFTKTVQILDRIKTHSSR